jgi:hypothetical protein
VEAFYRLFTYTMQGRIQDFKLGGAHLKKLRRAEGSAKIFGVFRVKNHDFTPKNHIFPILKGAREIFGVFHVKNHDFTPKKNLIFTNFRGGGGGRRVRPPPESPLQCTCIVVGDPVIKKGGFRSH